MIGCQQRKTTLKVLKYPRLHSSLDIEHFGFITHVRCIKILTGLRCFLVIFLYLFWFSFFFSLLGIARKWSREKFAILTLKTGEVCRFKPNEVLGAQKVTGFFGLLAVKKKSDLCEKVLQEISLNHPVVRSSSFRQIREVDH